MSFPRISVVTPNYNYARYLEQTIQSVISQNYPNLEYIIIDGGSTDGSIEIIKKYESHITRWVSEKDGGIYDAIQKGLKMCTGDIMAWINSDDLFHKGAFFVVAEIFSKFPQINWLTSSGSLIDEYDRTVHLGCLPKYSVYDHYMGLTTIQQESTFWRRALWEKAGGVLNTNMKVAADFDLWTRYFRHEKLYAVNALLGGFRARSANQASLDNKELYGQEIETSISQNELSPANQANLNLITRYVRIRNLIARNKLLSVFNKQALVNRLNRKIDSLKDYPSEIAFDRYQQQFILTKAEVL